MKRSFSLIKVIKQRRFVLAAFFLPVIITTAAFAVHGIYPFGENQITVIDMYHQYVPFLSELQYKLQHGGSLLYSWDGAAGFNFWNLLSYYGASPLNLLLIIFPEKLLVEAVTVILLIKIGLAGSFMYLYLTGNSGRDLSRENRAPEAAARVRVAFSSMYALNAYILAYFWCIMWIDVVALLPLCILGLERLLEKGRGALYSVTLALIIFCNYYIAIMVCIFIVLYFLMFWFSRPREGGFWGFVRVTGLCVWYSVLGAAMSAAMLLPTCISMRNAYYYSSEAPADWEFYSDPLEVFNQLLPNAELSFREGLPNIWCGLFTLLLMIWYFFCRAVPVREKITRGALLALLFMSLNVNKLDYVWHGCHFPNQLPFRYSFMICFLLIAMACTAFARTRKLPRKTVAGMFAGGLAYYLLAAKLLEATLDDREQFFYIGVALLAAYCGLLAAWRGGYLKPGAFSVLLVIVVSIELFSSTALGFDKVGNVERDPYLADLDVIEELAEYTAGDPARTELYDWTVMNTPALFHYRGISQFSSSLNSRATELMEKIGVEGEPGKNRYNYVISDPVTNAILNLKYIIAVGGEMEDDNFILAASAEGDEEEGLSGGNLYENRYPLALGYLLPYSIDKWDTFDDDPFNVLDGYVSAATDGKVPGVFKRLETPYAEADGLEISEEEDGAFQTYGESGDAGRAGLHYTAVESGNHYVYIEADQAEAIDVEYADGSTRQLREDCGAVVNIGNLEEGEEFSVQITYQENGSGMIRCYACTMDMTLWDRAYALISRNMLAVSDFGDTYIKGSIDVPMEGVFMTSVLDEPGWTLTVDGARRGIDEEAGAFISTTLTIGHHDIELHFRPPGLIAGIITMLCGILALIATCQLRQRRQRSEMTPEISSSGI